MKATSPPGLTRRKLLTASMTAAAATAATVAQAATLKGIPEWVPFAHNGPLYYETPGWQFFTDDEAAVVGAIAERLIPADELSVSGKDAGCVVFIDRQLAGEYGGFDRLYMRGPFHKGTAQQGDQSPLTPRERYRQGIAALQSFCKSNHEKGFQELSEQQRDELLSAMEKSAVTLPGFDARMLFVTVLNNTMEGFFADPIYGGNREMVSWKMIGFPGARYDYRDYVDLHNQKINLIPLAISGSSAWQSRGKA